MEKQAILRAHTRLNLGTVATKNLHRTVDASPAQIALSSTQECSVLFHNFSPFFDKPT